MIGVIDYGLGNIGSVMKALRRAAPEEDAVLVRDSRALGRADKVLLPGVGAMADGMAGLEQRGLVEAVRRAAREKPFLGICLGMQMLYEKSEEGSAKGLAVLAGEVRHLRHGMPAPKKIPHMGWNEVFWKDADPARAHFLAAGAPSPSWFTFVHSYFVLPRDPQEVLGTTDHAFAFAAAVARENIAGVQFHPEKSGREGLALLRRFCLWKGD